MKHSFLTHGSLALVVLLGWVAIVVTLVTNRPNWGWVVVPVLLGSFATMVGTALLSRFWLRRKKAPSYGTLFGVPLICTFLICIGPLLWDACRYNSWYLLTPGFWQQTKGGFAALYRPIEIIGIICILPAAVIVLYYQGKRKTDAPWNA